ncbi:outer membrane protein assembly factor BamB family protein [Sandaracinobacteroides sp. A072]|uniref:outer membrane protein assembly factor BamB family protein n=1 Tax=Sandaracinobacteroides sp. A072 TaxID=3461146 RepID=UPI00404234E0
MTRADESNMTARTGSRLPTAMLLLAATALLALPGCGVFKGDGGKKPRTLGERIAVLDFESQVEAEPELQGVDVLLPTAEVNPDWTQPGGNAASNMGHLVLSAEPSRQWRVSIGAGSDKTRRLNATPVIQENRLFAMDSEGRVSAFEASSGRSLWSRSLEVEGQSRRAAFGGGVSLGEGRLYATTGHGVVAALDPATGAEIWRVTMPTPLRAAPAVDGGRIYVSSIDGQLSALDASSGATLWQVNSTVEPAAILGAGAPAVALDTVVAGFASGELFALRVENGRTVWQDQLSRTGRTTALGSLAGITAAPVIDRGRVFAIGHGGRMAALELATGQRVWEREFAGVNTPWVAGDWVFAVTVDAQLVAMSRADGKIRWVTQLDRWEKPKSKKGAIEWFGPVLAGDRLYVASSGERLVAVSPASGAVLRTIRLDSPAYLSPVVANGMLYILTDDGNLAAFR